ncbi:MAG: twin-arginine translocation signal domain-containing protein, partial [Thermoguttaceae bacterium]
MKKSKNNSAFSRRDFLKTAGAVSVVVASPLVVPSSVIGA